MIFCFYVIRKAYLLLLPIASLRTSYLPPDPKLGGGNERTVSSPHVNSWGIRKGSMFLESTVNVFMVLSTRPASTVR